jgi:hypothetical protein
VSEPALLAAADAAIGAEAMILAGSGARLFPRAAAMLLPDAATGSLFAIASLAAQKWQKAQQFPNPSASLTMSPLYLRGADAKPQDGFALAHVDAVSEPSTAKTGAGV